MTPQPLRSAINGDGDGVAFEGELNPEPQSATEPAVIAIDFGRVPIRVDTYRFRVLCLRRLGAYGSSEADMPSFEVVYF